VVLLTSYYFDKGAGFPFYYFKVVIFQIDRLDRTDRNVSQMFGVNFDDPSKFCPQKPHSTASTWGKIILGDPLVKLVIVTQ
jgi:hypothetical protein